MSVRPSVRDTLSPGYLPTRLRSIGARTPCAAPKRADPFYSSSAWIAQRTALIAERGKACEACGRSGARLFGDHIMELRDGGSRFDRANLRLLCGACHTRKTVSARAARMAR